jgi:hypothetical protein
MRSSFTALFTNVPRVQSFQTAKEAPPTLPSEYQEWRFDKLCPVLVAWLVLYTIAIVGSLSESHVAVTAELQTGFDPILIAAVP